jgi:5-methylcytosine-specific restriction protein A
MPQNNLNSTTIKKAMRLYEKGERPFRHTEPRSWYVSDSKGHLYPLKYIYALAIGETPSSFNTSDPLRIFPQLGFQVHRHPKDSTAGFEAKIRASMKDAHARAERIAKAPRKPSQRIVQSVVFDRNPDVVAEVLLRANGKCEYCNSQAPFIRKKDKTPYLEVHHKQQLSHGGEDTVENAIAVCPNCHRQAHHG